MLADLLEESLGLTGWQPYPWQVAPADVPVSGTWLMMGGRGTGKTDGAAHHTLEHVNGPPCDPRMPGGHRIAIIAPTLGDASDACVNGPSGLRAYDPDVRETTRKGGTFVLFPNGSEGKLFGAHGPEDIERLRAGGNRCFAWWEELAAWSKLEECMAHSRYGLRIGNHPHVVASTTPKPRGGLKLLIKDSKTRITHGKTSEAVHLAQAVRDQLYHDYGGTRLGRQELEGELLEDVEGALWSTTAIEIDKLKPNEVGVIETPELTRVVVAVDPAGGSSEDNDETGIVVAGRAGNEFYVLADRSGRDTPQGWASRALMALDEFGGDRIVAERNFGADMVEHTLRSVRVNAPVRVVTASRGKAQRAEPISALYEQHRVHHLGTLAELESQMVSFDPDTGKCLNAADKPVSPDRMDALVWAITDLLENIPRQGPKMKFYGRPSRGGW